METEASLLSSTISTCAHMNNPTGPRYCRVLGGVSAVTFCYFTSPIAILNVYCILLNVFAMHGKYNMFNTNYFFISQNLNFFSPYCNGPYLILISTVKNWIVPYISEIYQIIFLKFYERL